MGVNANDKVQLGNAQMAIAQSVMTSTIGAGVDLLTRMGAGYVPTGAELTALNSMLREAQTQAKPGDKDNKQENGPLIGELAQDAFKLQAAKSLLNQMGTMDPNLMSMQTFTILNTAANTFGLDSFDDLPYDPDFDENFFADMFNGYEQDLSWGDVLNEEGLGNPRDVYGLQGEPEGLVEDLYASLNPAAKVPDMEVGPMASLDPEAPQPQAPGLTTGYSMRPGQA